MVNALKYFKPEPGYKFLTVLTFMLKTEFCKEVGVKLSNENGVRKDVSLKPVSLDAPLLDDEDSDPLYMMIPDERAENPEYTIYIEQLKQALDIALAELPEKQEIILRRRYYEEQTCDEIGKEIGCTGQNVSQQERVALMTLRDNGYELGLDQYIELSTNYYQHSGAMTFQRTGISAVERAVIQRERLAKSWMKKHGIL